MALCKALLAVTVVILAALHTSDAAPCTCDGLLQDDGSNVFSIKSDTKCGSPTTSTTPYQQNAVCLSGCDAQWYDTPNEEAKCKSALWCQVKNCARYKPNDCSVCEVCAAGFELELNDNPSRRACRPLKLPVLTCPLKEANLPPKQKTVGVVFNITVTDNIEVAGEATCTPASGTQFNKGTTQVTCTALDVNNNQGSCTFQVAVADVTPPEFSDCPANRFTFTVNVTDPQTYSQSVIFAKPNANDTVDGDVDVICRRDGVVVQSGNITIGFGETTVSCSATDSSLNSATCLVKYAVLEAGSPEITCPLSIVKTLPKGSREMSVQFTNITTFFAGGPLKPVACNPPSNSLFGAGSQNVFCTVESQDGLKSASCNFVVEVLDKEKPELFCPSDKQVDPPDGADIAAVTFNSPVLRDNVGVDPTTLNCTSESGDLFSLGITTVVCNARDYSNNAGSCNFQISVNDRQAPVFTACPNFPTALPVASNANTRVVDWSGQITAVDNAGSAAVSCSPQSGIPFAVETHIVTCNAVDSSGNVASCVFDFTITDETPPLITCPNAISVPTDAGVATTTVNFTLPTASDNVGVSSIECTRTPPAQFTLGRTTVTCFAFDLSRNQKTCEIEVNVIDEEDPKMLKCPSSLVKLVASRDATDVAFPEFSEANNITATDNDNTRALLVERFVDNNRVAGFPSAYAVGLHELVYRVTDAAGRTAQCTWSFKVEPVGDFEPPVIHNCPTGTVYLNTDPFKDSAKYTFDLNVTDNRPNIRQPEYFSLPEPSLRLGSLFPQGFTRLLITVKDEAGNADTCEFDIIVVDNENPELFCPVSFIKSIPAGEKSVFVRWDDPVATDNVAVRNASVSRSNGNFFEAGEYFTTFKAIDLDGNKAECNWTLSVTSTVAEGSSNNAAQLGALGGSAFAVIIVLVLLALLWARRTKKKILELEEKANFHENEEWVLARAQAIQQAMRHRGHMHAPTADLEDGDPARKRMQPPPSDLKDLYNLDEYMPYEAIARELERSQVELKSEIGSGEFGTVWDGVAHLGGQRGDVHVAVKMLKSNQEEHKVEFLREIAISGQFQHPNVVELVGFVTKSEPALMCLEFLALGNLKSYLSSDAVTNKLHHHEMLHIACDIAHGMHYIHTLGVVHRDLAARNVLVSSDMTCKICDFGLALQLDQGQEETTIPITSNTKLPVRWTALESITEGKWTTKSDVWSFGIVLWEIWTYAKLPYPGLTNPRVISALQEGERLERPPLCPMMVYAVMMDCWMADLEERLSMRRAYKRLVAAWGEQDEYDNVDMEGPPSDEEDEPESFGFNRNSMAMYDMGANDDGGKSAIDLTSAVRASKMSGAGSVHAIRNSSALEIEETDPQAVYDMGAATTDVSIEPPQDAFYDMGMGESEDMDTKSLPREPRESGDSYVSIRVDQPEEP